MAKKLSEKDRLQKIYEVVCRRDAVLDDLRMLRDSYPDSFGNRREYWEGQHKLKVFSCELEELGFYRRGRR